MARVPVAELRALAAAALRLSGACVTAAEIAAKYLVAADAQGLATHGVARVPTYCAHLQSGRAKGAAAPRLIRDAGAACLIDADTGLGFEPCELALAHAVKRAQTHGIGFAGVTNSHHCGALGVLSRWRSSVWSLSPSAPRRLRFHRGAASARSTAPIRWQRCFQGEARCR